MRVDDQLLWHDVLAAVLLKYGGKTLPHEIVVQKPPPESELCCDTVLVHSRDDGLHIKIISQKEAESYHEVDVLRDGRGSRAEGVAAAVGDGDQSRHNS